MEMEIPKKFRERLRYNENGELEYKRSYRFNLAVSILPILILSFISIAWLYNFIINGFDFATIVLAPAPLVLFSFIKMAANSLPEVIFDKVNRKILFPRKKNEPRIDMEEIDIDSAIIKYKMERNDVLMGDTIAGSIHDNIKFYNKNRDEYYEKDILIRNSYFASLFGVYQFTNDQYHEYDDYCQFANFLNEYCHGKEEEVADEEDEFCIEDIKVRKWG